MKKSFSQKIIFKLCQKIQYGSITIIDNDKHYQFSQPKNQFPLSAKVIVNDPKFYQQLLLGGSNGAAESYIDGHWDSDNFINLMEIIVKNEVIFKKIDGGLSNLSNLLASFLNFFKRNNRINAKRNIVAHYDLGNDFFESFLDSTMMYSSGIYQQDNDELEVASLNKLKTVCDLLKLSETDHLIEIGTGWGGLAIYAAQHYGCKVTTTTISEKQFDYVQKKILALNLSDKIRVLKKDYRDLDGTYDKLISIEMIEAVGHQYFDTFFKKCDSLLKPEGLMCIQAITINDKHYRRAKNEVDFIKKYIFPGGCLPSIQAINTVIKRSTDLQLVYLNDIGQDYAKTLSAWLKRFDDNLNKIIALNYSQAFIRMWRYYFAYCIAGFKQRHISNFQILWRKK